MNPYYPKWKPKKKKEETIKVIHLKIEHTYKQPLQHALLGFQHKISQVHGVTNDFSKTAPKKEKVVAGYKPLSIVEKWKKEVGYHSKPKEPVWEEYTEGQSFQWKEPELKKSSWEPNRSKEYGQRPHDRSSGQGRWQPKKPIHKKHNLHHTYKYDMDEPWMAINPSSGKSTRSSGIWKRPTDHGGRGGLESRKSSGGWTPKRPSGHGRVGGWGPQRFTGHGRVGGWEPKKLNAYGRGGSWEPKKSSGYGGGGGWGTQKLSGHGSGVWEPRRSTGYGLSGGWEPQKLSGRGSGVWEPRKSSGYGGDSAWESKKLSDHGGNGRWQPKKSSGYGGGGGFKSKVSSGYEGEWDPKKSNIYGEIEWESNALSGHGGGGGAWEPKKSSGHGDGGWETKMSSGYNSGQWQPKSLQGHEKKSSSGYGGLGGSGWHQTNPSSYDSGDWAPKMSQSAGGWQNKKSTTWDKKPSSYGWQPKVMSWNSGYMADDQSKCCSKHTNGIARPLVCHYRLGLVNSKTVNPKFKL